MVLIGSYDTHLYALDSRTGKLRWKLQTDGPVHATPAVQNGIVYIAGCDERFRAVRVTDGKVLFEIPLGSYTGASTAVHGERAYVGTFDAEMLALDLRTRKIVWRYRDPDREFPYYSSAALDVTGGTRVIVGGRDKAIHAIDAASGKSAWKFVTRARASIRRRPSRAAACTSARATASCTCSTPPPVRSSGSSTPATRSPHPPRSPRAGWSSARRTDGSTVSDRIVERT